MKPIETSGKNTRFLVWSFSFRQVDLIHRPSEYPILIRAVACFCDNKTHFTLNSTSIKFRKFFGSVKLTKEASERFLFKPGFRKRIQAGFTCPKYSFTSRCSNSHRDTHRWPQKYRKLYLAWPQSVSLENFRHLRNFQPDQLDASRASANARFRSLRNFQPDQLDASQAFFRASFRSLTEFRPSQLDASQSGSHTGVRYLSNFRLDQLEVSL